MQRAISKPNGNTPDFASFNQRVLGSLSQLFSKTCWSSHVKVIRLLQITKSSRGIKIWEFVNDIPAITQYSTSEFRDYSFSNDIHDNIMRISDGPGKRGIPELLIISRLRTEGPCALLLYVGRKVRLD